MKTLEEVITACSEQSVISGSTLEDVVWYLKEYRDADADLKNEIAYYQKTTDSLMETLKMLEAANKEINEPLTLDELLVMIGKPVWIESVIGSAWYLVGGRHSDDAIEFSDARNYKAIGIMEDYGKKWQAYRKER